MWFGKPKKSLLDTTLLPWDHRNRFICKDLLRSAAIFGASGSGKTTGSGFQIGNALAANRRIGGIILASKPEDWSFWGPIFARNGRSRDLLRFAPDANLRFNALDFVQKTGGDTREITKIFMLIGETLEQGGSDGGHHHDPFWRQQNERMIYNAVEIVRLALGRVTAPDIQRFITGAAQSPAALKTTEWQAGFHNQWLNRAFANQRTEIEKHDYQLALDYWLAEYPAMSEKTRSGIVAGVLGVAHVFNTGIVRSLLSTSTNVTPAVVDQAKWLFLDMPISTYGAAGALVLGTFKYLTQRHVLKRHATENTPVCVIWSDEYQKTVNSGDPPFLAEARSHRGCMVVLTQSIHALYARLRQGGDHEADSLLTNFGTKIFHALGDDKTAGYASSLVGRRLTTHIGTSMSPAESVYDELFGTPKYSASTSQQVENVLENRHFMYGLRTGGKANGYMVDGYVIRSGERFSNGEAFLRVSFSQR